jgi:hypothetical protein
MGKSSAKLSLYLVEVNPRYTIRGTGDKLNVIDARWIDTETGLVIDVSTGRANYTARAQGVKGALMCKDKHHYLVSDSLLTFPHVLTQPRKKTSFLFETAISKGFT